MKNLHFSQLVFAQAKKYGKKPAMYHRENITDEWSHISWAGFGHQVSSIAKSFIELGVVEQQRIAQFSQNKVENLIVDFALYSIRAALVPIYATSTTPQVEYIVNDAEIGIIFVGNQEQYNIAYDILQESEFLKKIIVFDKTVVFTDKENTMYYADFLLMGIESSKHFEVQQRQNEALETDLACILYTSGTTGNPKGAMLLHSNFDEAMTSNTSRLTSLSDKEIGRAHV